LRASSAGAPAPWPFAAGPMGCQLGRVRVQGLLGRTVQVGGLDEAGLVGQRRVQAEQVGREELVVLHAQHLAHAHVAPGDVAAAACRPARRRCARQRKGAATRRRPLVTGYRAASGMPLRGANWQHMGAKIATQPLSSGSLRPAPGHAAHAQRGRGAGTVGVDDVRDGRIGGVVLLVALDVLPERLDRGDHKHEEQRERGAPAAKRRHHLHPRQARLHAGRARLGRGSTRAIAACLRASGRASTDQLLARQQPARAWDGSTRAAARPAERAYAGRRPRHHARSRAPVRCASVPLLGAAA